MQDQGDEDRRCMQRLKNGDDLALNELMSRWKEPLIAFSLRYTGNLADARDIAQETFVKVHGSRHRYRPTAVFSTWLFTIAANLCRMRARWRARHPEVLEADRPKDGVPHAEHGSGAEGPREETDRNELARDLDRAVRELPHDLRVAFVLYEIQGQSYREVAQVLKCTEKAIERRLARARERLRDVLEEKWKP